MPLRAAEAGCSLTIVVGALVLTAPPRNSAGLRELIQRLYSYPSRDGDVARLEATSSGSSVAF